MQQKSNTEAQNAPTELELVFEGPIRFYADLGAAYGDGERKAVDAATAIKLAQDYGDVYVDLDALLRDTQQTLKPKEG